MPSLNTTSFNTTLQNHAHVTAYDAFLVTHLSMCRYGSKTHTTATIYHNIPITLTHNIPRRETTNPFIMHQVLELHFTLSSQVLNVEEKILLVAKKNVWRRQNEREKSICPRKSRPFSLSLPDDENKNSSSTYIWIEMNDASRNYVTHVLAN